MTALVIEALGKDKRKTANSTGLVDQIAADWPLFERISATLRLCRPPGPRQAWCLIPCDVYRDKSQCQQSAARIQKHIPDRAIAESSESLMELVQHRPRRRGDERINCPPEPPSYWAVRSKSPEQKGSQNGVLKNVRTFADEVVDALKGVVAGMRHKAEKDFFYRGSCMGRREKIRREVVHHPDSQQDRNPVPDYATGEGRSRSANAVSHRASIIPLTQTTNRALRLETQGKIGE